LFPVTPLALEKATGAAKPVTTNELKITIFFVVDVIFYSSIFVSERRVPLVSDPPAQTFSQKVRDKTSEFFQGAFSFIYCAFLFS
jgi:hypothetical protein